MACGDVAEFLAAEAGAKTPPSIKCTSIERRFGVLPQAPLKSHRHVRGGPGDGLREQNFGSMGVNQHPPVRRGLVERRASRIANARSVTFGLAVTFFALALVGGIVMRVADSHNFPSVGLATWWALQTVTTVGYGDVVPTTTVGKFVGGIEMVIGISLIPY